MRRLIILGALFALLALPSSAAAGGRPFVVQMTGAAERPGPGDADGSGTAWFWVNYGQMEICYRLEVTGIAPAAAAHIHVAPTTSPGPVVVPLIPPTSGVSSGCAEVADAALLKNILQNPSEYYVNVHNADFPAGALRGQLSK
jgi:hypothetical protein